MAKLTVSRIIKDDLHSIGLLHGLSPVEALDRLIGLYLAARKEAGFTDPLRLQLPEEEFDHYAQQLLWALGDPLPQYQLVAEHTGIITGPATVRVPVEVVWRLFGVPAALAGTAETAARLLVTIGDEPHLGRARARAAHGIMLAITDLERMAPGTPPTPDTILMARSAEGIGALATVGGFSADPRAAAGPRAGARAPQAPTGEAPPEAGERPVWTPADGGAGLPDPGLAATPEVYFGQLARQVEPGTSMLSGWVDQRFADGPDLRHVASVRRIMPGAEVYEVTTGRTDEGGQSSETQRCNGLAMVAERVWHWRQATPLDPDREITTAEGLMQPAFTIEARPMTAFEAAQLGQEDGPAAAAEREREEAEAAVEEVVRSLTRCERLGVGPNGLRFLESLGSPPIADEPDYYQGQPYYRIDAQVGPIEAALGDLKPGESIALAGCAVVRRDIAGAVPEYGMLFGSMGWGTEALTALQVAEWLAWDAGADT